MKAKKILFLSTLAVTWMLTVETYADVKTNKPADQWYISGFLGTHLSANGRTKIPAIASDPPLTSHPVYNKGYNIDLGIGYKFHQSFRIEGQLGYQDLPMKKINDAIGPNTVTQVKNSDTKLFSFFINGYYDLRLSRHWIPYFGAGLGYLKVWNAITPTPPIPVAPGLFFTEKKINYNTFGYQGILGIAARLPHNILLNLNYKYFSTFDKKAMGRTNLGPDGYLTKQRVTSNVVSFGIIYFFN